jgi:DNA ligase (NAD+)
MNIQPLETQYLKAKIAYYAGEPIMNDASFDALEQRLKDAGSKVIEQVGSKRKDFDFPHPTPMKSLAKIQTALINGITDYQEQPFGEWLAKRQMLLSNSVRHIYYSPKFDGSAINIVYRNKKLESVLTRGDGISGKDATDRFKSHLPNTIDIDGIVQIRCEAVMAKSIFDAKYAAEFANARNIVAGIIGKDDIDVDKIKDLTLVPLHYIIDGMHTSILEVTKITNSYPIFSQSTHSGVISATVKSYIQILKYWEQNREKFEFQLDGVVFSLPNRYREILGENEHDPEWAIAIKFVPDEVITSVEGIEWNISKTGELNPVVLLKPVELAGTKVKRASGYNAGYILENKIGPDTLVSLAKAGDIIPEIQAVTVPSGKIFDFPHQCPYCGYPVNFDGIHLTCVNKSCVGKIAKSLSSSASSINIKGIGCKKKTISKIHKDFKNWYEVF